MSSTKTPPHRASVHHGGKGINQAGRRAADANIAVCVRVRPMLVAERASQCQGCVKVRRSGVQPEVVVGPRSLAFDHVFEEETTQEMVYESCVKELLEGLFMGYNACILCYGQTGSGKSYTMGSLTGCDSAGDSEVRGVIPRVIEDVFAHMDRQQQQQHSREVEETRTSSSNVSYTLRLSFVEVYNEEVRDLLDDGGWGKSSVVLREDSKGNIVLAGAREVVVANLDELSGLLQRGTQVRATASTALNETSSRSHAIFTLVLEGTTAAEHSACTVTTRAKIHLVDLAGSERLRRTNAMGTRFRESVRINQGLLALGKVINALNALPSAGDEPTTTHVPYRDSKLTRLLQDSLGGNSRTVMIACVSPADIDAHETVNTLKYAHRARAIRNTPTGNVHVQLAGGPTNGAVLAGTHALHGLQCALDHKQAEVDVLSCRLAEVCQRVAGVSTHVTGLQACMAHDRRVAGLAHAVHALAAACAHGDQHHDAMHLATQMAELELAVSSRDDQIEALKRTLQEKEEDLVRDEKIFASKMKEIERCRTCMEQQHEQISALEAELSELRSRVRCNGTDKGAVAEAKGERVVYELDVAIRMKRSMMRTLRDSGRDAEALVQRYEQRVATLEAHVHQLHQQQGAEEGELREAESELAALRGQRDEQGPHVAALTERSRQRLAALQHDVRRLEQHRQRMLDDQSPQDRDLWVNWLRARLQVAIEDIMDAEAHTNTHPTHTRTKEKLAVLEARLAHGPTQGHAEHKSGRTPSVQEKQAGDHAAHSTALVVSPSARKTHVDSAVLDDITRRVPRSVASCCLKEVCRDFLSLRARLHEATALCEVLGRKVKKQQHESEDKIQYLLSKIREYEGRSHLRTHSATQTHACQLPCKVEDAAASFPVPVCADASRMLRLPSKALREVHPRKLELVGRG